MLSKRRIFISASCLLILVAVLAVVYQPPKPSKERYQTIDIIRQSNCGVYVILDNVSHRLYLVKYADGKGVKSIPIGKID
jgi:surface polysaccharide O-acyltransferase-like enzyme